MPTTCIVQGCKSRHKAGESISFSRVPMSNVDLCKQWLIRAGMKEESLVGTNMSRFKNYRICSLHFEGDKSSRRTSLPTLNIPGTMGCGVVSKSKATKGLKNVPSYAAKRRSKKTGSTVVDVSKASCSESVVYHPEGVKLVTKGYPKVSRSMNVRPQLSSSDTTRVSMSSVQHSECKKFTVSQHADVLAQSFKFETSSTESGTEDEMSADDKCERHGIFSEAEDSELLSLKFVKTESGSRQCIKCLRVFDEVGDFDEHVDDCYSECRTYPVERFSNIEMKQEPSALISESCHSGSVYTGGGCNIKQDAKSTETVFASHCDVTDASQKLVDNAKIKVEVNDMSDNDSEESEVRTSSIILPIDKTLVDADCKTDEDNCTSKAHASCLETGVVDELEANNNKVPMVQNSSAVPVVSDSSKNVVITGMYYNVHALISGQRGTLSTGTNTKASCVTESAHRAGKVQLKKNKKRGFDQVPTADVDGCSTNVVKWPASRIVVGGSPGNDLLKSKQAEESDGILKSLRQLLPENRLFDCFFKNCTQYFTEGELDLYKAHLQQELRGVFLPTNKYIHGISLKRIQGCLLERNLDWQIFSCTEFECEFMCFSQADIMTHITSTHVCTERNCGKTFNLKYELQRHKIVQHDQFFPSMIK